MKQGICPVGDHTFEYEVKAGMRRIYCSDRHQRQASNERQRARRELMATRTCSRCRQEKPSEEFPGTRTTYCKACWAAKAREERAAGKRKDSQYARISTLRRYGLTLAQFDALLDAQDHRCAVCLTDTPGGQGWHVDHDHTCCSTRKNSCGRCVRGLLCTRCNIGIGNFRDDPAIIQAAIDYITAYRARREVSDRAA